MKRRTFIRNTALTLAGTVAAPYILPGGRLFAATGARKVNHVVFCLFAGGVRNLESMEKAEGNLMRYLLQGNESISPDIAPGMTPLPPPPATRLQQYGTLYKEFRYASGPTGHYNGHTTAITGRYTDSNIKLKEPPQYPTVFEYYRKHTSPGAGALNAWWISDSLGPYPFLNYSKYDGYGAAYGANMLAPLNLLYNQPNATLGNPLTLTASENERCIAMREFMNGQFKSTVSLPPNGVTNTPQDAEKLRNFLHTLIQEAAGGLPLTAWGVPMNSDMINIYYGIRVLQEFKPELLVINMQAIDIGHFEFTKYINNIRLADFALYKLWEAIQSTPGLANDTVLIVAPEHGRNLAHNSVVDIYGRYALDHTNDEMSRRIFCFIAGPSSVVKQNQTIQQPLGESIDIVPTIANLLGFDTEIPAGMLPGRVLQEAFV
ncbi:MAG: hypothetical protein NZM35_11700 [Chitinophagales bacterium]|nr:hypothetical protein [Chitinophagales bacterium]MDW8419251.1 hypothetical protein [Chitinophagales bacterium]